MVSDTAIEGALAVKDAGLEDLTTFRRWSHFLPRGKSEKLDNSAVYVRSRSTGNPKFFEETRKRLQDLMHDFHVFEAVGFDANQAWKVQKVVIEAQWIAVGFMCDRQMRKAVLLCEDSLKVINLYSQKCEGLLFFRALVSMNLGAVHSKFLPKIQPGAEEAAEVAVAKQYLESTADLKKLRDDPQAGIGTKEMLIIGACHAHLCMLFLHTEEYFEAERNGSCAIEIFEELIWKASDEKDDVLDQAATLAAAYANMAVCCVSQGHHDKGLSWYTKAMEVVSEHIPRGDHYDPLLDSLEDQIEHTKMLKQYSKK
jgi:hypothetical protein